LFSRSSTWSANRRQAVSTMKEWIEAQHSCRTSSWSAARHSCSGRRQAGLSRHRIHEVSKSRCSPLCRLVVAFIERKNLGARRSCMARTDGTEEHSGHGCLPRRAHRWRWLARESGHWRGDSLSAGVMMCRRAARGPVLDCRSPELPCVIAHSCDELGQPRARGARAWLCTRPNWAKWLASATASVARPRKPWPARRPTLQGRERA